MPRVEPQGEFFFSARNAIAYPMVSGHLQIAAEALNRFEAVTARTDRRDNGPSSGHRSSCPSLQSPAFREPTTLVRFPRRPDSIARATRDPSPLHSLRLTKQGTCCAGGRQRDSARISSRAAGRKKTPCKHAAPLLGRLEKEWGSGGPRREAAAMFWSSGLDDRPTTAAAARRRFDGRGAVSRRDAERDCPENRSPSEQRRPLRTRLPNEERRAFPRYERVQQDPQPCALATHASVVKSKPDG